MRSPLSQLSLHKLEVFCLVAELASFSRAAERLGVAQPVVSAHVKALSRKVGVALLHRNNRRVALTEEGRRVYDWARETVSRTHDLEREMAETRAGAVGKAIVAASMTLGSYVLPAILNDFRARTPRGEISVRITTPLLATDAVHAGECDFGFTFLSPRHDVSGLVVERVADERLILVRAAAADAGTDEVAPADLSRLPFLGPQAGSERREIEDAALAAYGVTRGASVMEFGHAEAIKQAARAGAGYAFLFASSARDELAAGLLVEVATPGMALRVPMHQVYRRRKKLTRFQLALMGHIAGSLRDGFDDAAGHA